MGQLGSERRFKSINPADLQQRYVDLNKTGFLRSAKQSIDVKNLNATELQLRAGIKDQRIGINKRRHLSTINNREQIERKPLDLENIGDDFISFDSKQLRGQMGGQMSTSF